MVELVRMIPLTKSVNKQLLPLYDKPLNINPLSVLLLAPTKNIKHNINKGQLPQFNDDLR